MGVHKYTPKIDMSAVHKCIESIYVCSPVSQHKLRHTIIQFHRANTGDLCLVTFYIVTMDG